MKRLHIGELEKKLKQNRFDSDARKQLSYYDRVKVLRIFSML
jgi:hypothetical protein